MRAWFTTAGELLAFVEAEIAAGRNPKTRGDWDALMARMAKRGKCRELAGPDGAGSN